MDKDRIDALPRDDSGAIDWSLTAELKRLQNGRLRVLGELLAGLGSRCRVCESLIERCDEEAELRDLVVRQITDILRSG